MNLQNVSKEVVTVGLLVLSLVVLEWLWLDWQFSRKFNRLENQVENLPHNEQVTKEQVEAWIKHIISEQGENEQKLKDLIDALNNNNILTRYNAGMKIRQHGSAAVLPLVSTVKNGNDNAREAALILLNDLDIPEHALPKIRAMAEDSLTSRKNPKISAGLISVLTNAHDMQSVPLFEKAVKSQHKALLAAGLRGIRKLEGTQLLPLLLRKYPESKHLIQREIENTILSLCENSEQKLKQHFDKIPPKQRFTLVKILKASSTHNAESLLKKLTRDKDDRVALAAAKALANRGESSAVDKIREISEDSTSHKIRTAAEKLIENLSVDD